MRKVKLSMQMTINGFVGGTNGEMNWMTWNPDDEFLEFINSNFDHSDILLLGRKTAKGFIEYWENVATNDTNHPFAKKIADMQKVVFTKNSNKLVLNNTIFSNEAIVNKISQLKKQNGKDILVIGGASFVASLIKENLIDEYHFIINPTAIADGMTVFNLLDKIKEFTPTNAKLYSGGKIVLSYLPKK